MKTFSLCIIILCMVCGLFAARNPKNSSESVKSESSLLIDQESLDKYSRPYPIRYDRLDFIQPDNSYKPQIAIYSKELVDEDIWQACSTSLIKRVGKKYFDSLKLVKCVKYMDTISEDFTTFYSIYLAHPQNVWSNKYNGTSLQHGFEGHIYPEVRIYQNNLQVSDNYLEGFPDILENHQRESIIHLNKVIELIMSSHSDKKTFFLRGATLTCFNGDMIWNIKYLLKSRKKYNTQYIVKINGHTGEIIKKFQSN